MYSSDFHKVIDHIKNIHFSIPTILTINIYNCNFIQDICIIIKYTSVLSFFFFCQRHENLALTTILLLGTATIILITSLFK